jgi:hypothetical protein
LAAAALSRSTAASARLVFLLGGVSGQGQEHVVE